MKIKACIIGDVCVGKTHMCNQMRQIEGSGYYPTIGVEYCTYNHGNHELGIWDISGNPTYQSVTQTFLTKCDIVVCVYNNLQSFNYLKTKLNTIEIAAVLLFVNTGSRMYYYHSSSYDTNVMLQDRTSVMACFDLIVKLTTVKSSDKDRSYCWFY